MVELSSMQITVLVTALTLLIAQLFVRDKQTSHILFALFCVSISFTLFYKLSGDSIGIYKYLIGMGACATCNVYWLLARTLFREKSPIEFPHIALALFIAILLMARQGQRLVNSIWGLDPSLNQFTMGLLGELTVMLSSVVLIMSCWEALRGFGQVTSEQKAQRAIFLSMFVGAVAITKTVAVAYPGQRDVLEFVIAYVTITVLLTSQVLIIWITNTRAKLAKKAELLTEQQLENERLEDELIANQIRSSLIDNKQFLQSNLKVADVARELDKPEFKISRVLRRHFDAKNFNQFVNELRIEHAKALLTDVDKQQWSVLVVGLESGFASVGPFTRAFKFITGYTPNQYRKEFC